MKILKKLLIILFIIIAIIISYLVYDAHFSKNAKKGKENMMNAEQIRVSMTEQEVKNVMGEPDNIENGERKLFRYKSNNIDYMDIEVSFDSVGKVSNIFIPKEE
jgi:uncharacterized ion transporter superfamily protein YfcC